MDALQGHIHRMSQRDRIQNEKLRKMMGRTNYYRRYTKETTNMIRTRQKNDRGKVVVE